MSHKHLLPGNSFQPEGQENRNSLCSPWRCPVAPSTASVTAHAWLHRTGMEGAPSDSPEPKTVLRTQPALNKGLLSGPPTGRGTGRAGAQLPEGHSLPLPSDSVEQTGCHAGRVGRASVQGPAETGPVTGSAVATPCHAWRGRPRQAWSGARVPRRGHRLPPEGDAGHVVHAEQSAGGPGTQPTAPGTLHLEPKGNRQIWTLKPPGGKQSAVRQSENTAPKMARDGLEG